MTSIPGGLNAATDPLLGSFTSNQNRAILAVGLACSCISLTATLITLRWFLLMKRLFRHRLVLYLILSDTFKAFWYFVFPIVVFTRGPVQSSSAWCQASGWFLAFAIEASDFAILIIALHAMLYIFRPQVRIGQGGLYKYRKWMPVVWLGPPVVMASLAFINNGQGYITAGTFCYLPKRPLWYRLALSYIPRYMILLTIFCMYAAISVYVHIKFQSFKHVVADGDTGSVGDSENERNTSFTDSVAPDESPVPEQTMPVQSPQPASPPPPPVTEKKPARPVFARGFSHRSIVNSPAPEQSAEPWDNLNFITSKPLNDAWASQPGVQAADFAPTSARGSASSEDTRIDPMTSGMPTFGNGSENKKPRQASDIPTINASKMETSSPSPLQGSLQKTGPSGPVLRDPLQRTRVAIRHQLRFMFIYPGVYALMWAFPFVQNCLLYSDYYASHPVFWLQIVSTCCLSLQAAVDCLVFSWRERPWRRVDQKSKLSIPFWRQQSIVLIKRLSFNGSALASSQDQSRKETMASDDMLPSKAPPPAKPVSNNWWEAEGRKRKDSVWMGTDLMTKFITKQSEPDQEEKMEGIPERPGSI